MAGKVWVIGEHAARGSRSGAPADRDATERAPIRRASSTNVTRPRPASAGRPSPRSAWLHVAAAYALGPLTVACWVPRVRRLPWAIAGAGSVAAAVALLAGWPSFLSWTEGRHAGVPIWVAVVAVVAGGLAVTWSRAIAAVGTRHPLRAPEWLRHPRAVVTLGLLVPGLGLYLVGRRRAAARVFALLGPMAASALVLSHGSWLWELGRTGSAAGLSGNSLELVLLGAAGALAALLLVWLVQALEGARRASLVLGETRSDSLSFALLAALAMLALTPQGAPLGRCLHDASVALRAGGFRIIPLVLCETAVRLDPASPAYLADAVEMNERLGRVDRARAERALLEARADELRAAVDTAPRRPRAAAMAWATPDGSAARAEAPNGATWTRIHALTN
jgi:hypothetical protein